MKSTLNGVFSVAVLLLSTSVMAQNATSPADPSAGTVAALSKVQGNVLVSDAAGMASAVDNQRIKSNVRVTTTSRAAVTITFDNGCVVQLKENERIDVDGNKTCAVLLAAVQAVPLGVPIGAVAATGLSGTSTALLLTGAGVGGYLIYRNNRNVSPN